MSLDWDIFKWITSGALAIYAAVFFWRDRRHTERIDHMEDETYAEFRSISNQIQALALTLSNEYVKKTEIDVRMTRIEDKIDKIFDVLSSKEDKH